VFFGLIPAFSASQARLVHYRGPKEISIGKFENSTGFICYQIYFWWIWELDREMEIACIASWKSSRLMPRDIWYHCTNPLIGKNADYTFSEQSVGGDERWKKGTHALWTRHCNGHFTSECWRSVYRAISYLTDRILSQPISPEWYCSADDAKGRSSQCFRLGQEFSAISRRILALSGAWTAKFG
jgi:hypothetical protein